MKRFFLVLFMLVWGGGVYAATVPPPTELFPEGIDWMPQWHRVGGDPCRENPDCTAAWAFTKAAKAGVLPTAIAERAIADFEKADAWRRTGDEPTWQTFYVCHGDILATSFGATHLRFVSEIKAAFDGCTTAHGWSYYDAASGATYETFRVDECGNLSVRVRKPQMLAYLWPESATPLIKRDDPLGVIKKQPPGGHVWCCRGGGGGDPPDKDPDDPDVAPVPIPASAFLLGGALFGLGLWRRRTRRTA